MILFGFMTGMDTIRFWCITIGYMLASLGQYSFYLVMMISIINTVEYNEYKHGTRDEAISASLRPFLTKMASAVIAAVVALSYMVFGVTGFTNQISDLEQQASQGLITEAVKMDGIDSVIANAGRGQTIGMLMCITVLPFILMLISYFMYKRKYKLDEEEYNRICAELEARKQGC